MHRQSRRHYTPVFVLLIAAPGTWWSAGSEAGAVNSAAVESRQTRPLDIAPVELELIDLINQERLRNGLPELRIDARLMAAAANHSVDMAGNGTVAHRGSDGSEPDERVIREGYRWRYVAENIGCGQQEPQEILNSWLRSPGHRENLLSADASDIGVALATRHDRECQIFWTAVLATERR